MAEDLHLYPGFIGPNYQTPHLKFYKIGTADKDEMDFDDWRTILLEIVGQLTPGLSVVADHNYKTIKEYKKRILFPDHMPEYSKDGICEKLIKEIVDQDLNWHFLRKEYREKAMWYQKLYIINHHPDESFFKTICPDWDDVDSTGISGGGYLPDKIKQMKTMDDWIEDYERKRTGAIYFILDMYSNDYGFYINPSQYPIKQFIQRIQSVTERYKVKLEVEL